MKEQDKPTFRDFSETDNSNMPDGKFKATNKMMLVGREIKELKKQKSEMKNVITDKGNRLDEMNTKLEEAEE